MRLSRRPSCALGVGTQRTKRLEHVLHICWDIRFLYVHGEIMYLFVYVPVAGRIAPASARNRIGPLSMRSTSKGSPVWARGLLRKLVLSGDLLQKPILTLYHMVFDSSIAVCWFETYFRYGYRTVIADLFYQAITEKKFFKKVFVYR